MVRLDGDGRMDSAPPAVGNARQRAGGPGLGASYSSCRPPVIRRAGRAPEYPVYRSPGWSLAGRAWQPFLVLCPNPLS
jgi:hypothetical protein